MEVGSGGDARLGSIYCIDLSSFVFILLDF